MEANIERFKNEIKPFVSDWRSIDLRVIASRSADKWIYGAIRIVLDTSEPSTETRKDLPSIDGLLVAHERWEINRLDELLDSLSSGEIHIDGKIVVVENANCNPKINYSFQRMDRQWSFQRFALNNYSFYLQNWAGISMFEGNNEAVDSLLQSSNPPWDGVRDLLTNFLGVSPNFSSQVNTKLVEIIAPLNVKISMCAFYEDNTVLVNVEANPLIAREFVALSSIGLLADGSRMRLRNAEKTFYDESNFRIEVSFGQKLVSVDLILTYHDISVDRSKIFEDPGSEINPRLALLHKEKLENFLNSLRTEKDKFFEDKVSLLFHVLGFSSGHYGRAYPDNLDILVFPSNNQWMLAVECTEQEIDISNKLSKLATRTKLLVAATPNISVFPVIVTKFPSAILNDSDKEKAAKERIAIITSDSFEGLIQLAIEGANSEKIRDFVLRLVPF